MYILLTSLPKEVYDLGVAGILCMVIWGLTRGITEWLRIRHGESSSVKLQTLSDIVTKISFIAEKLSHYDHMFETLQAETRELRDVHCGEQAYANGRPRWYVSDEMVRKIDSIHSLLIEYDQRLSLVRRHCQACDGSAEHLCIVAQVMGVFEAVEGGPTVSPRETQRRPSGRTRRI